MTADDVEEEKGVGEKNGGKGVGEKSKGRRRENRRRMKKRGLRRSRKKRRRSACKDIYRFRREGIIVCLRADRQNDNRDKHH